MRLIDAEELERDGWHLCRTVQVDRNTMEYQTKKPTAFTTLEVVRCKDCEYYDIEIPSRCIKDRCYCATVDSFMKTTDYCSYGERKRDADMV